MNFSTPIVDFKQTQKIQLFRNSGKPVDPESEQAYINDWRSFYDKCLERALLDNMKLQRFLSFGERLLQKKHYVPTYAESFEQLAEKIVELGYPITLGISQDTGELIGIIQD